MILEWLRWIAILPAAIGAYLGLQVLIIFISALSELYGKHLPDIFYQFINSIASAVAFVWAGAKAAPKYHYIVAICLTVIISIFMASITSIAILKDIHSYPLWWLIVTNIVSIISAIICCVYFIKENSINN